MMRKREFKTPPSRYNLYQQFFELDIEYTHMINKYPLREKWVLCAETRQCLGVILRYCLDAKDDKDKLTPALAARREVRYLDQLTRKAFELGYIGNDKHKQITKMKLAAKDILSRVINSETAKATAEAEKALNGLIPPKVIYKT